MAPESPSWLIQRRRTLRPARHLRSEPPPPRGQRKRRTIAGAPPAPRVRLRPSPCPGGNAPNRDRRYGAGGLRRPRQVPAPPVPFWHADRGSFPPVVSFPCRDSARWRVEFSGKFKMNHFSWRIPLIVVGFRVMNGHARRQADGTDHEADQDAGNARIRDRDQGRHRVGAGDPGRGVRRRRLPPDRGGDQHQRGARDRGKPLAPLHRRRHREIRVVGAGSERRLRPAGGPDQPLRNETGGRQCASHPRRTTMTTFTIDTDNNIAAHAAAPAAQDNLLVFSSQKELSKATAEWPISRLVEIWNSFAGTCGYDTLKPVKKFTDRKAATTRIWAAIQVLGEEVLRTSIREAEAKLKAARTAPTPAPQTAPKPAKKAKGSKAAA